MDTVGRGTPRYGNVRYKRYRGRIRDRGEDVETLESMTIDSSLRSVGDIPFEFVGKVASACTVAKASDVKSRTPARHD